MDEGHTADIIYIDVAEAFDSVNHRIFKRNKTHMVLSVLILNAALPIHRSLFEWRSLQRTLAINFTYKTFSFGSEANV